MVMSESDNETPSNISPESPTDKEIEEALALRDMWFEGKKDEALSNRILDSVEELRKWVCENGAKKEPPLPEKITKINDSFEMVEEGLYYRIAEDAPDPFMIWGIDIENDPISQEQSGGLVFRLVKDNESNVTYIDVHYPNEGNRSVKIGLSVIKMDEQTGERNTVNFPPRELSRISTPELKYADVYLRQAKQNFIQQPRGTMNTSPKFRRIQ